MGIRLLVLGAAEALSVRPRLPTLVAPLDAGSVVLAPIAAGVGAKDAAEPPVVDKASIALLPRGFRAEIEARSPLARVLLLSIGDALEGALFRTYSGEVDGETLSRYLGAFQILPRTNWLNEICHRYLFERSVCKKRDNDATRFLETEILKEVYFLSLERDTIRDRASIVEKESRLVERAVRAIEAKLFEPAVLRDLPRSCNASASTLLRAFKRELGQGPREYVRARRLDEAMLLLKSRGLTVGEIAVRVGYLNLAAFSHAFRARFGKRPSEVRAKAITVAGDSPRPQHGARPRPAGGSPR